MPDATADTATETETTTTETVETTETVDYKAEADKFKALARKHEDRAKANAQAAKELEQVRAASMSDQEKAVAVAKAEARTETMREFGSRLATEAIRGAAAGRVADVDAFLEGVDPSKFLTDDGEPDRAAIGSWLDRIAPQDDNTAAAAAQVLDLGQGVRGSASGTADPLQKALEAISHR